MMMQSRVQYGTFFGVFAPTILNITGTVLYLRTGWLVGNGGLLGAMAVILISMTIVTATALSVASIATNSRYRSGPFFIIAQSLGLEVGASVALPFYLAQSVVISFYLFAFAEGWMRIFPGHNDLLVLLSAWVVAFTISRLSDQFEQRTQRIILGLQGLALASIFLGTFTIAGNAGLTHSTTWLGGFEDGNFWVLMAVFFPGVTGVLSGVAYACQLRNYRTSIPKGILAAVGSTLVIYIGVAIWFAHLASPAELRANSTAIADGALYAPLVLTGLLSATFSLTLLTMHTAPGLLATIAEQEIFPGSEALATRDSNDQPYRAQLFTAGITLTAIVLGWMSDGLNSVAPLTTMFYLTTYATINGVMLVEQSLDLVTFRPLLRVPNIVPLIGLTGCLVVMVLINPIFSIVAVSVIVGFYTYLSRRHLMNPFGDVRSGLFVTMAEWAAKRVAMMSGSMERAWKPSLLVPIQTTEELLGAYRFLRALTHPRGSVHVLAMYTEGCMPKVQDSESVVKAFIRDDIFSRVAFLETDDFAEGLELSIDVMHSAFFKPNALFMSIRDNTSDDGVNVLLQRAKRNETGAVLFAQHPEAGLGREQVINVWIRDQSPKWEVGLRLSRLDLSLLLAYQVSRNWHGQINLITIVSDASQERNGQAFLHALIELGRMPVSTQAIVKVGPFDTQMKTMPHADLNIFGISDRVNVRRIRQMMLETRASCIFVLDSGHESALA